MTRSFIDFLREQRGGQTEEELATQLNALVKAVGDTNKKGKLVLTITVDTLKADSSQMVVTDSVQVKLPEKARGGSVFFATPENNLSRKDPRQHELSLKTVSKSVDIPKSNEGNDAAA